MKSMPLVSDHSRRFSYKICLASMVVIVVEIGFQKSSPFHLGSKFSFFLVVNFLKILWFKIKTAL